MLSFDCAIFAGIFGPHIVIILYVPYLYSIGIRISVIQLSQALLLSE